MNLFLETLYTILQKKKQSRVAALKINERISSAPSLLTAKTLGCWWYTLNKFDIENLISYYSYNAYIDPYNRRGGI